jgi:hypothetical protein
MSHQPQEHAQPPPGRVDGQAHKDTMERTQQSLSLMKAYQALLQKKDKAPEMQKQEQTSRMPADSVQISPDAATMQNPQTKAANKEQQQGGFKTLKEKLASMMALKQLVAKSAELFFNIDNKMTFNFISQEVEQMMQKLVNDYGIETEKVMDAKLEGKHISQAKIFESVCVMIALAPLIGAKSKKSKVRANFEVKIEELKNKLAMLGYDVGDEEYMVESARAQAEKFLEMLNERMETIDMRLACIKELEELPDAQELF